MVSEGTPLGILPGQPQLNSDIGAVPGMTKEDLRANEQRLPSQLRAGNHDLETEEEYVRPPLAISESRDVQLLNSHPAQLVT